MSVASVYQAFSVTPNGGQTLLLNGALESSEDELGARLASFEYLKRDGAEVEPMGAAQAKFSFRVILMGSAPLSPGGPPLSAGQRYVLLVQAQRKQPRCMLVHPRLGRWQVGWVRLRGSEQPQRAVDTIEVSLDFIEDQLDQAVVVEQQPTPQAQASQVVSAYSILTAAMGARFTGPSQLFQNATAAAVSLGAAATTFVNAALDIAQTGVADPSLGGQLGSIKTARDALLAALGATLAQTLEPEVSLLPYRHQAYLIHAYCLFLLDALRSQQPVLVDYVVLTAMSLDQILVALYGSDAPNHLAEVLALNRIQTPLWIAQGTTLQVVAPPVIN